MEFSPILQEYYLRAIQLTREARHECYTPEHMLRTLCEDDNFAAAFNLHAHPYDINELKGALDSYLVTLDTISDERMQLKMAEREDGGYEYYSFQLREAVRMAYQHAYSSGCTEVTVPHFVKSFFELGEESVVCTLLTYYIEQPSEFLASLASRFGSGKPESSDDDDAATDAELEAFFNDNSSESSVGQEPWRKFVTCITDEMRANPDRYKPLIGREEELERTIQVLCRCDKNNPLHVGEPGVGKTALIYGLARRINEGNVPDRLKGCSIYLFDLGNMLADTQYRGDFEKRIKLVMEGISEQGNGIVYIDEIHNIVGAGRIGDNSMDAANMLKPYLESGIIRFIGSTTYAEYNRHFAKAPGMIRRFQQIDIPEPSVEDTVLILEGLRDRYERFHNVVYDKGVFEHTVKMADRYINERFLPDKAIDLIDEAGAQLEALQPEQPEGKTVGVVTRELINEVLARVCKVNSFADKEDDMTALEGLDERIKSRIYGQDEAVRQVVEAVQMSHAGLMDEGKPVASFLFVSPTGVGKTEVARVLAQELNLELVRFDMSEYAEKHTVAKFIGAPAGYVGYEDGGLLTDAVRKNPHCVLLFDEIEKAHPDVFNIFLQMMDYASLTDNQGRKADFRHCVIIMTSNAGAQFASQASVGFGNGMSRGDSMLQTVRKTFKPEFIARLSGTVVFRDMDKVMAEMIFDKKLGEFTDKLAAKHVTMTLSPAARQRLLSEGFTEKTGAREMDRVIAQHLKPLFSRAILFGSLKNGGDVTVDFEADNFVIK